MGDRKRYLSKNLFKKESAILFGCCMILALSLCACDGDKQNESQSESGKVAQNMQAQTDSANFDFMTEQVKWNQELSGEELLYIQNYREWDHSKEQVADLDVYFGYNADQKNFITVIENCKISDKGDIEIEDYFLERMDPLTGDVSRENVSKESFYKYFEADLENNGLLPAEEVERIKRSGETLNGMLLLEKDNILYVTQNDEGNIKLFYYDKATEKVKEVANLGALKTNQICELVALDGTKLYYATSMDLIRWDLLSGERKIVFHLSDGGLSKNNLKGVAGLDGTVYLRYKFDGEDGIFELGKEEIKRDSEVRFVDIYHTPESKAPLVEIVTADYYRKNPQFTLTMERTKEDLEAYKTRVMADIMNGESPDMLLVDYETMRNLSEKGWTADLRDFCSEETLQEILPGVLEAGTIDGRLVGIAPAIYLSCMFTKKSMWDQDTWTSADFVQLMKEHPDSCVIHMTSDRDGRTERSQIFFNLIGYDIDHCEFIDWENGKCHFDSDSFVELLKCVASRTEKEVVSKEIKDLLDSGECIALDQDFILNFDKYVMYMDLLGEDYNVIGYPSKESSSNYLSCWSGYLVVNKNTTNKEAVSAYIELLLSEKEQTKQNGWGIRKNPLNSNRLIKADWEPNTWEYKKNDGSLLAIKSSNDVTKYLQDFNEMVEKSRLPGNTHSAVADIMDQEVAIFFEGIRSAEETAKVIQNRVQLYLDEGK